MPYIWLKLVRPNHLAYIQNTCDPMWVIYVSGPSPAQGYTLYIISTNAAFVDGDTSVSTLCYSPTAFALILYQANYGLLSSPLVGTKHTNTSFSLACLVQGNCSSEVDTDS